jgi:hypothetical protein
MVEESSFNCGAHAGANTIALSRETGERRKARRFEVDWQTGIEVSNCDGEYFNERTRLKNISSTGAYFELDMCLEKGTELKISIKLPLSERNWMIYSGKVVRTARLRKGNGIAVLFQELRPSFSCR